MKKKAIVSLVLVFIIFCSFNVLRIDAGQAYDLSGEWTAVFVRRGIHETFDAEAHVIKIDQNGMEFVGISLTEGKRIGKNEEAVKGKLSGKMIENAFISYVSNPITFESSWSKGRALINNNGNLIVIYSFIESIPIHKTATLVRKE